MGAEITFQRLNDILDDELFTMGTEIKVQRYDEQDDLSPEGVDLFNSLESLAEDAELLNDMIEFLDDDLFIIPDILLSLSLSLSLSLMLLNSVNL